MDNNKKMNGCVPYRRLTRGRALCSNPVSQENTMIGIILTLLAVIALGILGEMVSGEF